MQLKTIKIANRVEVTVRELVANNVADIIDLFSEMDFQKDAELDIPALMGKYRTVKELADTMLTFSADSDVQTIGEMSYTEIIELVDAWKEVNGDFLEQIGGMAVGLDDVVPKIPSKT